MSMAPGSSEIQQANEALEETISLDNEAWEYLMTSIEDGLCTPFLGAGASFPYLPTAKQLAREWSERYSYPLEDDDLSRVAQFLAVRYASDFPKSRIRRRFARADVPKFTDQNNLHGVLAQLPLPVYMTTNYDDFMSIALKRNDRNPKRVLCRWNDQIKKQPTIFETDRNYVPDEKNPVVFHLHGFQDVPESLVLTEDDYVDFMIKISEDKSTEDPHRKLLPPRIEEAFTGSSLLFLGYSLADWNFRMLFRMMVGYMKKSVRRAHVSVQLAPFPPTFPSDKKNQALTYLNKYFQDLEVKVYWGSCKSFAVDLQTKWQEYLQREK